MKAFNIGTDATSFLANQASNTRKLQGQGGFEQIMAYLTQTGLSKDATTAAIGSSEPVVAANPDLAASAETTTIAAPPIQRLKQALETTGQAAEKFTLPTSQQDKLQLVLEQSGYSKEDAQQIISRAKDKDGNINLGAVFNLMTQYVPAEAPVFQLKVEDKPLLVQALKDLGISQEKISEFMESLPQSNGKITVSGLPRLLAEADPEGKKVDRAVLTDLLTRLGLSKEEVSSLITKATDTQGRTSPKAMLALLTVAAQRQDQGVSQALKEMAAQMRVAQGDNTALGDPERLKAQVEQAIVKIEQRVQAQTSQASSGWQKALEQAQAALDKAVAANPATKAAQIAQADQAAQTLAGGEPGVEAAPQVVKAALAGQAAKLVDGALASNEHQAAGNAKADAAQAGQTQAANPSQAVTGARAGTGMGAAGSDAGRQSAGGDAANAQAKGEALTALAAAGRAGTPNAATAGGQTRATLPPYVVRQVGDQMAQMVARQQSTLRLELKPPTLGELHVELAVKEGVLKATLTAETVAAKQALEAGMDQLKNELAQQGLKVERIEIAVNPDAERQAQAQAQAQTGSGGDGRQGRQSASAAGGVGSAAAGEEETGIPAWQFNPANSRVNLFA